MTYSTLKVEKTPESSPEFNGADVEQSDLSVQWNGRVLRRILFVTATVEGVGGTALLLFGALKGNPFLLYGGGEIILGSLATYCGTIFCFKAQQLSDHMAIP